ncbi:MAG: hypothetical protein Q7K42_02010 [Candidatus Diapherotrites archaeon]|nr:hypothetical protein [Candidatus Diapherotrites archaeon]
MCFRQKRNFSKKINAIIFLKEKKFVTFFISKLGIVIAPKRRNRKTPQKSWKLEKNQSRFRESKIITVADIKSTSDDNLRTMNDVLRVSIEKTLSSRLPALKEGAEIRVLAEKKKLVIFEIVKRAIEEQCAGKMDEQLAFADHFRKNKKTGKGELVLSSIYTTPRNYIGLLAKAIHIMEMRQIYAG